MYAVVHVAVDQYDSRGEVVASLIGARAVDVPADIHDLLGQVLDVLPASWRQLSYNECLAFLTTRRDPTEVRWEQLSIF